MSGSLRSVVAVRLDARKRMSHNKTCNVGSQNGHVTAANTEQIHSKFLILCVGTAWSKHQQEQIRDIW